MLHLLSYCSLCSPNRAIVACGTTTELLQSISASVYNYFVKMQAELEDDHAMYLRHHPELKCIMADFLQFLLLRKPEDTLNFAGEYFASFSSRAVDLGAYANSAAPTPFPPSRTNTILSMSQKLSKK